MALRTLGTFPFGAAVLLGFVRRNVVEYLDDDDPATRREAALTCCRLLEVRSDRISQAAAAAANANGHAHDVHAYSTGSGDWSAGTEEFIMSRLLAVAVSDLDAGVRKAVLASFCRPCPATDSHLGQADALQSAVRHPQRRIPRGTTDRHQARGKTRATQPRVRPPRVEKALASAPRGTGAFDRVEDEGRGCEAHGGARAIVRTAWSRRTPRRFFAC